MKDKIFFNMGKWNAEYDGQGNCTRVVYDEGYLRLIGRRPSDVSDSENIWRSIVHPDDLREIDEIYADLFQKRPEGKDYDMECRMLVGTEYRLFHFYGHCIRREDGSVRAINGVMFDIQDIVDRQDAQKALSENYARIFALEDDFEVLYDVELATGHYDILVKGQTFGDVNKNLINNNSFFDDVEKNLSVVHPEDRQGNYDVTRPEFIREALSGEEHFDRYYRLMVDGRPAWARMRIVYKDAEKTHIIIGVFDAEHDIKTRQLTDQKEQLEKTNRSLNDAYQRIELLHTAVRASLWTYDVDADGNVTAAHYDEHVNRKATVDTDKPMGWVDSIHPEDRESTVAAFMASVRDRTGGTPYEITYRLLLVNGETAWIKTSARLFPHADGTAELTGISINITDQMLAQQKQLLGAVPLSNDVLSKANIGLWAFELDEGHPPRMYADEAMLRLLGLAHQEPPEVIYHAWYDHIDKDSFGLVDDAVQKMAAGEHAEVQYPWHHPDGHTMIVRCGGVLNPGYTKGIRIEGTHQDVTETLRFDEEEIKRLRNAEDQLRHEQLRAEVLNYMMDHDDDPIELLKNFAERIRVLLGCDQVIYRDLEETRIMVNSDGIAETWSVPIEYCRQCQHFDAHHPMYALGYTEMANCQEGWQGIPVYEKCPIKSSLTRLVYCDGEIAGYLAIHFVQDYHTFTPLERTTLEEFTRILSISLSRYKAMQENAELKRINEMRKQLEESDRIIGALAADYGCVNYVTLTDDSNADLTINYRTSALLKKMIPGWEKENTFTKKMDLLLDRLVYAPDREMFYRETRRPRVLAGLRDSDTFYVTTRLVIDNEPRYYQFQFSAIREKGKLIGVVSGLHSVDAQMKKELEAQERLQVLLRESHDANAKLAEQSAFTRYFLEPYQSAYYIGLDDRSCQIYKQTAELRERYPVIEDYEESLADYIDRAVHPEDQQGFLTLIRPEKMKELLSEQPQFYYTFRANLKGTERHYRFQVIRGADEAHAAFGIRDITEEWEKEQAQYALSDGLSREYHTVWLMEGSGTHDLHLHRSTGGTAQRSTQIGLEDPSYDTGVLRYIREFVHEDDQARVTEETKFETVEQETPETGTYVVTYRRYNDEHTDWDYHQMCYARAVAADGTVNYIFAFRDADRMLRDQIAQQEKLAQRTVLSDYFLRSYSNAYYVNLKEKTVLVLHAFKGKALPLVGKTLPFDELISRFSVYAHPDDREKFLEYLSPEFISRQISVSDEFNFTYRDISDVGAGTYRCTMIPGADQDHAAVGFQDITEDLRQQQLQQQQLEEALSMAQSANRAKTTFLNNMSHDIRTPMNAIIGYTGLAASHIGNTELVQDYLGKIGQSSEHLLSLINDVLDMSRIESGKMNLEEKEENLSDIIHTLRDIIQADIRSKQLDFYVDAVDVNDEDIICDKLRLNQVLLNVLSNAVKYTPAGGTVTMRVLEKTVRNSGYGTYEFRVKDNGMGMDAEFLKTIFDPFTRVKSSTVSGIQGTGLGMAITKNIIDMMGGTIQIESEPGKGTEVAMVFDFKLQSAPSEPEEIPELAGVRGLIVDDDANTCMSIANMLRDIGMRDEWCTSGKEAVIRAGEAFRRGDLFKVFIIDWLMPDMNGIETTRRIRKVIGDDTPIIILTAYDWSDIEEEAREAGVTAFVSKPMFPSDLHRVLNKCLGKTEEPEPVAISAFDFAGRRLLLVEDNALNREIATEILEEEGFIIDTAEDGDIAVEKMRAAKAGDYDLVLMDVQMPVMDGYEATRQIRALGTEIAKIPIIAMTANAFEEDRKLALEAGMNEHVTKPIDIHKLKETLARFL